MLLLFAVLLWSCENDELPEPVRTMPDEIRPYVDRFMWEAQQRGIFPDTSMLSIEFERNLTLKGEDRKVLGLCTRSNNLHQIKFDTLTSLWLLSGYLGREEIVFHELGHCLLGRPHRDDKFISGDYASIMRSAGLLQYSDLEIYNSLLGLPVAPKAHRREYYLHELFNEDTSEPCWADSNRIPPYPVKYFNDGFILDQDYRDLWIDNEGHLWLFGGGNNYRYQNGAFVQLLTNVGIFAMNNSAGGQLWVAGVKDGQSFIGVYRSGVLEIRYNQDQLPGEMDLIDQILIDDLDRVWISDWFGNLGVSSESGFDLVDLPGEERVTVMEKGPDNKIYLLKEGLFYVVENASSFIQYESQNSDLPTSFFRRLKVDRNGTAWLQPTGSSYILNFNPDRSVKRINLNEVNLSRIGINDLFSDHQGDIWVATSNGLRKWEGHTFSEYCTYNSGFKIIDFSRILASGNGDVWSVAKDPATKANTLILAQTGN